METFLFLHLGPVSVWLWSRQTQSPGTGEQVVSAFLIMRISAMELRLQLPHVKRSGALMWSANPKLIGNIDLTEKILEDTARSYTGTMPDCVTDTKIPNDAVGYGILDAYAAVKAALNVK
jgi:hypothetical protein